MPLSPARLFLLLTLLGALTIAGCAVREETRPGADSQPAVTPQPAVSPTPTATMSPPDGIDYTLVISEKQFPDEATGDIIIELAGDAERFGELWEWFGFLQAAPEINWGRDVVLFFGTGESGSCPLELNDVRFDPDERLIVAVVDPNLPPETACTMDWTPRVFGVAIASETLGDGELRAGIEHAPRAEEITPSGGKRIR